MVTSQRVEQVNIDASHLAASRQMAAQEVEQMRRESDRVSRLSKDALLNERGRLCPHCQTPLEPRLSTFYLGRHGVRQMWVWPHRHGCQQEQAAVALDGAIDRQNRMAKEQADYQRSLERAGLIGLLGGYRFDEFSDRKDWPDSAKIRARVRVYANAVEQGTLDGKPWLILHGAYGTGKSHLAGAVVRQMIDSGRRECYFRVWGRYLKRLQASWDKRRQSNDDYESDFEIVAELTRGFVVAIDDLDKQPPSDWTRSVLFDVINTRYNSLSPTVLTFNHGLEDGALQDYIGKAVFDRIMQHAFDVIEFTGPSFRQL
jgi:DNA replication protein DnaC